MSAGNSPIRILAVDDHPLVRGRAAALAVCRPRRVGTHSDLKCGGLGQVSSDRTIAEYANEIWNVPACPVPENG
ncbi:MAG TPA: hypothetical protein VKG65_00805 [Terriglobales bacterium]|nr:hypothetical protein [Terriglobales bacterium]